MFFPAAANTIPAASPPPAQILPVPQGTQQHSRKRRKCVSCPSKTKLRSRRCARCQRRAFQLVDPDSIAPIKVDGGLVHFTDTFKYLGSVISADLSDDADCDARILAASGAFGALRTRIFEDRRVPLQAKRMAYQALVLNVLFYGCEAWALSSYMERRLKAFHHRCIRSMTGYTLRMGRVVHSITGRRTRHFTLLSRLRLAPMDVLLHRRRLQWLGHVYRMPTTRLPRRLLSSWLPHPRPVGRPRLTFGHSIIKTLNRAGLDATSWENVAANRRHWGALLDSRRLKTFASVLSL